MEAIDLGLSIKWSNCNLGASCPEKLGNHYAWGEVIPKNIYNWETYKWCKDNKYNLTKYNTDDYYGKINNKTVLDLKDDAAHMNWGAAWRMPTYAECTELRENCMCTWTDDYNGTGVAGQIVTSKTNGNHIFLPAAGFRYNDDLYDVGYYSLYWSSSLYTDNPKNAWGMFFSSGDVGRNDGNRYFGLSVRPVIE